MIAPTQPPHTTQLPENSPQHLHFRITPAHIGQRVDVVLAQLLPDYSRSRLQQWCEAGVVLQNGIALPASAKFKKAAPLTVTPQADNSLQAFSAESIALDVVYEDEYLAVIHKPVGMVVHPGAGNWTGTLMNGLLHRYPESASLPRAGIVHRLDRDTSGLMVVARTSAAYNGLVHAMKARDVQRRYIAMIHGVPGWLEHRVDAPIGRDPKLRVRMAVVQGTVARPGTGKPAMTDARTIASNAQAGASLLECKLHSGRTHQIRVHMQHVGHSLLGDTTYGGKPWLGMTRQALHAWRLGFTHPVTGEAILKFAPPPADIQAALTLLGVAWADLEPALKVEHSFSVNSSAEVVDDLEGLFDSVDEIDDFDDEDDEHEVELIYTRE